MAELKTVTAIANNVSQTPRKVSLVASLVRGRSVADALTILEYTPKRAALVVKKALASAMANAVSNYKLDEKTLVISSLSVTTGTRLKRFRAGARGMAKPYQKRSSNIRVEVAGEPKKAKPVAKPAAAKEKK